MEGIVYNRGRVKLSVPGAPGQAAEVENPRDGGAWWAAVSGVAQGRTVESKLELASQAANVHTL